MSDQLDAILNDKWTGIMLGWKMSSQLSLSLSDDGERGEREKWAETVDRLVLVVVSMLEWIAEGFSRGGGEDVRV